ncbi:hypothetical protein OAF71_01050 [bacterium]|nr:hypothetical protein [bacterium]
MPHFAEPVFQENLQSAFFQNSVAMTPSPLLKNLNDLSKKKENKNFYWRLQSVIAIQFKCPVAVESDGSVIVSSHWLAPMVAKLRKSLGRFSDRA